MIPLRWHSVDDKTNTLSSLPALWKEGDGIYRALAVRTVLIGVTRVTAGLVSAVWAAIGRQERTREERLMLPTIQGTLWPVKKKITD